MKRILSYFWGLFAYLAVSCTPQPISNVDAYLTTADRVKDFAYELISFTEDVADAAKVVVLDSSVRYQEMDGFGAAMTGSTCYNLMQMAQDERSAFLYETFSTNQKMGFSYIRVSIGCSDFSLSEYTCCDKKGIENFTLTDEETKYVIPILKEVLRINPSLKIMGSPWTCPPWMKVENLKTLKLYKSWTGGQLNPKYYSDYATYFVKWIKAFEEAGVPIYSVTPQNEPLHRGNSASLFMGWQEQQKFVKILGKAIRNSGLRTKIYAFDHNYNYDKMEDQQGYPLLVYEDSEAASYLAGAAYHNYGGDNSELERIHQARPDKELVFTETSIGEWNDGRNLHKRLMADMREIGLGTVNHWCKSVIVWNLMLDSGHGPNRQGGCQTCYGAVDIETPGYKNITRNSHYYVIGHLSSVIKPGAYRIKSEGYATDGFAYAAFINPDGTFAFVAMNDADTVRTFSISDGEKTFDCTMPAHSIASYRW